MVESSRTPLRIDFESSAEAVLVLQDGRTRHANSAATALTGYTDVQLDRMDLLSLVHSKEADEVRKHQQRILQGDQGISDCIFRLRSAAGPLCRLRMHSVRILYGGAPATLNLLHEIAGTTGADLPPWDESRFRLLTEQTSDVLWVLDAGTFAFTYVGPSVKALRGYTAPEALAQTLEEWHAPDSFHAVFELLMRSLEEYRLNPQRELRQLVEVQQPCRNGDILWVEHSLRFRPGKEGQVEVVGISRNIEDRKRFEQDLVHRTYHDPLTGLYNRQYLEVRIREEIERSERYDIPLSIALFDLDRFRAVNDAHGHAAGDQCIVHAARTIGAVLRESDILVRTGGEDFLAVFPQTGTAGARIVAEKMRRALEASPCRPDLPLTASFGVAERKKAESYASWLRRADEALYLAKGNGRNLVVDADDVDRWPVSPAQFEWRAKWECGLPALDRMRAAVVSLANDLTGRLSTEPEAEPTVFVLEDLLVRMQRLFDDEIPLLERSGYAGAAGHAELHAALRARAAGLKASFLHDATHRVALQSFLIDELIDAHLLTADIQYFPAVRGAGAKGAKKP